ncbi:MAG: hypothetical protein MK033_11890, partial [Candidatus Caenarcaniphilales bacterium]|nr:hypothetical protein [Candidatus Caenarcaniphilales bacterium]
LISYWTLITSISFHLLVYFIEGEPDYLREQRPDPLEQMGYNKNESIRDRTNRELRDMGLGHIQLNN